MDYKEEDYLMLSGIQHFAFCRRQWALIHIEQQWQENERTAEGELLHERAHDTWATEKRSDVITSRGLPVQSRTMGISGSCDIVEFHRAEEGVPLYGHRGLFRVYPIEYKRGKPKDIPIDMLQLTAQAMCLEEMLSAEIAEGAIYYGEIRHREKILFTEDLRTQVRKYFQEMHQLFDKQYTPNVKWSKSCNACSLNDICMPKLGKTPSVKEYVREKIMEEETP
ncbi:CRISPR-associated Cas4 family exonuclease [Hungatella effluvii]|uniref:CRISPR-associated exonuclease Cas4 n=1 Tax=Hungatella effluvii TaxID=1096246 RepID=A0A2V3Y3I9_9FIRM|nr:CRISPR-associated protein Cas4 [Hungatella effluvii]PXX50775.1 CRISPR-associated Cas4 family exonuclease [Hungatella effluvii]